MIGGQIVPTHAMAKQLPLSQDVLWTRRSSLVCLFYLSVRIAETLAIGDD